MHKELSRYEMNQMVKAILVKHRANLTKLDWTSSKKTIYIYGSLYQNHNDEFAIAEIEILLKDLKAISNKINVQVELQNWVVRYELGAWTINKKKHFLPIKNDTIRTHRIE